MVVCEDVGVVLAVDVPLVVPGDVRVEVMEVVAVVLGDDVAVVVSLVVRDDVPDVVTDVVTDVVGVVSSHWAKVPSKNESIAEFKISTVVLQLLGMRK